MYKGTDYLALATDQSVTSTTLVDIPGMSLSLTTTPGEVLLVTVGAVGTGSGPGGAGQNLILDLLLDGVVVAGTLIECDGIANALQSCVFSIMTRIAGLLPGVHTLKLQWRVNQGSWTLNAATKKALGHHCEILVERVTT